VSTLTHVRPATPADVEHLLEIEQMFCGRNSPRRTWRKLIEQNPLIHCTVATAYEVPIGYAIYERLPDRLGIRQIAAESPTVLILLHYLLRGESLVDIVQPARDIDVCDELRAHGFRAVRWITKRPSQRDRIRFEWRKQA
jgi:hypothetical protein